MERQKQKKLLDRLDRKLNILQREMQQHPAAAHLHQPRPGDWSALQVCRHLQLSEALSLRNLEYNLDRISTRPPASVKSGINLFLLRLVLASPMKFRAPQTVSPSSPADSHDPDALFSQWIAEREILRGRIENLPDGASGKQLYKHTYAGYLTATQMIRFFEYHFDHHLKQISRKMHHWAETQGESLSCPPVNR